MDNCNVSTSVRYCIAIVFVCSLSQVAAQGKLKKPVYTQQPVYETKRNMQTDTVPQKKQLRYSDQWQIKQQMKAKTNFNNVPVDTVTSFDAFLQMKAGCETVKTLGDDGSILIRYPDGFTKKMYDGLLVEVITADGVRHVPKRRPYKPTLYLDIIRIPPPVPGINDPLYKWLNDFNQSLESDIRDLIGKTGWGQFLGDESEVCNNNIYKQIQFRTKFLENYSTAH